MLPLIETPDALTATLKAGDDAATIKSTGETITSKISAGTRNLVATVGTECTATRQDKEIQVLKEELRKLQEVTVDSLRLASHPG